MPGNVCEGITLGALWLLVISVDEGGLNNGFAPLCGGSGTSTPDFSNSDSVSFAICCNASNVGSVCVVVACVGIGFVWLG